VENNSDGLNSRENMTPEQEPVESKDAYVRDTKEIENKMKMLSMFELSILRCCSSNRDQKVQRCFEVNGFGGVNFLTNPCRYLDMDKIIENNVESIENNRIIYKQRIEKKQKKMLSKFELAVVRCCSSILDTKVGRCFEANRFGGIHFLRRPCQLLQVVLEKKQ
jgi:hypothetical protein